MNKEIPIVTPLKKVDDHDFIIDKTQGEVFSNLCEDLKGIIDKYKINVDSEKYKIIYDCFFKSNLSRKSSS